ncbi:MAG: hypothetical protein ABIH26_03205 [Candidatus Eisenbacteria bacterium]
MSLYAAEAHARTDREEVLLSRLFGTLKMLDRETYLATLLCEAGIDVAPGEYASLQIQFWPELGPSSPDLALESDSFLVFVVGWDRERVRREELLPLVLAGRKLSPRFHLLVVTDGNTTPPGIEDVRADLRPSREPPCRWLGWPKIYEILHHHLGKRGEAPPARDLIEDLLGLLASEGRAPFVGFGPALLRSYRDALSTADRMTAAARLLAGDLDARLQNEGIRRISTRESAAADLPAFAARTLDLEYADESWDAGVVSVGTLFLQADLLVGEVRAGFRCNATDPSVRALLVEGRSRIAEALGAREEVLVRVSGRERPGDPCRDATALALLETQNGGARIERVELLSIRDGTEAGVVSSLVKDLAFFRDLALSVPLLPLPRVNGESPFVVAGQ